MSSRRAHLTQGLGKEIELLGGERWREEGEPVPLQRYTKPISQGPQSLPHSSPPVSPFQHPRSHYQTLLNLRDLPPSLCPLGPASEPSLTTQALRVRKEGLGPKALTTGSVTCWLLELR